METALLRQEIDAMIAEFGDETNRARPELEHGVLDKIRLLLEQTRPARVTSEGGAWETYLPYAAQLCGRLARLEEGWEDELEFFALENTQFWLDSANACLEAGQIEPVIHALDQVEEAARLVRRDMLFRSDALLQALDIAIEISDKKRATRIYEEAEKLYRKRVAGSDTYIGSAWLPRIKKMGKALAQYRDKITRYYHYAESISVAIEADTPTDLERVIDYLQQSLPGKVRITKRASEAEGSRRARVKITLE